MIDIAGIIEEAKELGFKLTDNVEHRELIIKGLIKKEGYCPCRVGKDEDYKCVCIDLKKNGICKCSLFVREG